MWLGTSRRRRRIVGLTMDPSLHRWGSGSGRCVETSTGRLPAKPSDETAVLVTVRIDFNGHLHI